MKIISSLTYVFSLWLVWYMGWIRSKWSGVVIVLVWSLHLLIFGLEEKRYNSSCRKSNIGLEEKDD